MKYLLSILLLLAPMAGLAGEPIVGATSTANVMKCTNEGIGCHCMLGGVRVACSPSVVSGDYEIIYDHGLSRHDCHATMEAAMRAIEPFYKDQYGPAQYSYDDSYSTCDKACLKKKLEAIEKYESWHVSRKKAEQLWAEAKTCWRERP